MKKVKFVMAFLAIILVMCAVIGLHGAAYAEEAAGKPASMIDLTFILKAVITLVFTLVASKLIPWIQSKTTESQQKALKAAYRTVVFAAEQLYGAGNGEAKLDYAIKQLEEMGFTANRAEIEAAVWEHINRLNIEIEDAVEAEAEEVHEAELLEEEVDIGKWSLEQLKAFCIMNHVPHEGCESREQYMDAIEKFFGEGCTPEA